METESQQQKIEALQNTLHSTMFTIKINFHVSKGLGYSYLPETPAPSDLTVTVKSYDKTIGTYKTDSDGSVTIYLPVTNASYYVTLDGYNDLYSGSSSTRFETTSDTGVQSYTYDFHVTKN